MELFLAFTRFLQAHHQDVVVPAMKIILAGTLAALAWQVKKLCTTE